MDRWQEWMDYWSQWSWMELMQLGAVVSATVLAIAIVAFIMYRNWRNELVFENWNKKAVFITGCDQGFGFQLALDLDSRGVLVYAGCHSEKGIGRLKPLASKRMRLVEIEVTDANSIRRCKQFIEEDLPFGVGLWGVVNNAGIVRGMVFEFAKLSDYRQVLEVNFFGVLAITAAFLPLVKKERGRIINMVSIMGRCSVAAGPYSCSKYALEAYSDGLRRAMKNFGVGVSVIEPGFFRTGMTDPAFWDKEIERLWHTLPKDMREDYGENYKTQMKDNFLKFVENPPLSYFNTVDMVVADMVHSIMAKRPKDRYVSGIDGIFLYRLTSFVPDWINDFFYTKVMPYPDLAREVKKVNGSL